MYTPLYIKTDYSLLSSLVKLDSLIKYLKKYNITSCGICDDNLFGTMEIYDRFIKEGIKPIIGLDLHVLDKHFLLYAKNENGYHNLVHIEILKNDNLLDMNNLVKYKDDLIMIVFDIDTYNDYKDLFNIYIGINNKKDEDEFSSVTKNIVYINSVLYLEKYEYKYLPYVFMIRDGKTINEGIDFKYQNNYLYTSDEVMNVVSINAINNTNRIADMVDLTFTKNLYMPKYDTSNSSEFLTILANKGLYKRCNGIITDVYKERLDYELGVIIKMHFEDYFLVVYDYIKYAKKNDILVGPGRGSAAGSLVSYCLGITEIDPIKFDLLFERFLNPERITMPDIDTDFPDSDRDRVIDYVKNKYGDRNVAGIITFGTLGAKQAVRDLGRVLSIRTSDIDFICKRIGFKDSLKDLIKKDKDVHDLILTDDKLKTLYNIESIIEGNKRHTSVHAAGIVISYKDLSDVCPIIKSDDMYLTEYTMDHLEEIGLIKMDFLGIKNLSIIKNILLDVKNDLNININFNDIALDDSNALSIFNKADTTGIFQFESSGMRQFLRELKVNNFSDVCSAIALFRPGPAINIPTFIKRREGKEKIDYIDDRLKPILEETSGIIVYQEQIMQIASVMANYSLGEADILRRAMSKKKLEILKSEEERFVKNSVANGYSLDIAKRVYDMILSFANYGFNKSHSISYSVIAYKMAYLKYYYPKYFYSNLLNGVTFSDSKTLDYIKEVKKMGQKVLPPSVNLSYANKYRVLDEGLLMPLSCIRNIGDAVSNFIVNNRNDGYSDIYDFLSRCYEKTNNSKVLESLNYSHSLECLGININTFINNIDAINNYIELTHDIVDNTIPKPEIKKYEEISIDDILENEKNIFGFYLTSHKSEKYKLNYKNILNMVDIKSHLNIRSSIIFCVDRKKELTTKSGDLMAFVDGSDNTSSATIVFFPKVYDKSIKKGDIIKAVGIPSKRFDEYQFVVDSFEIIS